MSSQPRAPLTDDPSESRAESVPVDLDGTELWLSVAGVTFDEGIVYAFRDLTEERAVEQLKSDFVATVSHELRTPLAAIYGAAVTLRRSDLDLEDSMQQRLLGVIADESDRLAHDRQRRPARESSRLGQAARSRSRPATRASSRLRA